MSSDDALTRHLDTLYLLARVMAGREAAGPLVEQAYRRAAATPPSDRPADVEGWLVRLLLDVRNEWAAGESAQSFEVEPSSGPGDPLQHEVARETAERMLLPAFAACSVRERAVLVLDALGASDEALAQSLDTTPGEAWTARERARGALRASLRDVLSGPERMLVDAALPEDALQDLLRDRLAERFSSPSAALRTEVTSLLNQARQRRQAEPAPSTDDASALDLGMSRTRRRLVGGALVIVLLVGAAYGLLGSPSSPSSSSSPLVAVAAPALDTLRATFDASSPQAVQRHLRTSWGRRAQVPSVADATLQGVARFSIGRDAPAAPVLLYDDRRGTGRIAVFALNYALLDQWAPRVRLDSTLRTALADSARLVTDSASASAAGVLWRQRDEVYLAVAPHLSTEALRTRLTP